MRARILIIPEIIIKMLFGVLICTPISILSQELPRSFKTYSAEDGLSSSTIYDILKDEFGFLWLATEDGLNRFDGTTFKSYRYDPQQAGGLRTNHVTALHEGGDGSLWIGTNGGALSFYDRSRDSIISYEVEIDHRDFSTAITAIASDNNGFVWVASYGGLYIIDAKTKHVVDRPAYNAVMNQLNGMNSLTLFYDSQERMWIGTDEGLFLYTKDLTLNKHYRSSNGIEGLADNEVMAIAEDSKKRMWIGTMNGISLFNPNGSHNRNFNTSTTNGRISSNTIYALATDGDSGVWVGTDEGLDILDISSFTSTHIRPNSREVHSLSSRSIRSILIDHAGIYWIGTFQGGLNKYDKNLSHFVLKESNPFDPSGLRAPVVTSFAEHEGNAFVGTDGGGLHFYNRNLDLFEHIELESSTNDRPHDLNILAMTMTRNGKLWIGTYHDGLFGYDPLKKVTKRYHKGNNAKDLNHNDVFCVKEDRQQRLWIGTNGGGINILSKSGDQIEKYVHQSSNEGDPRQPSSNYIRALEEDSKGQMWVGTYGSGISVFNPETGRFVFYTKQNSALPSNYILAIKEDQAGNIWVGTEGNGVGLLKRGDTSFQTFSETDGLINSVVVNIVEDQSGKLWFSTNRGLTCYEASQEKFKSYSRQVGLQSGAFMRGAGICLADGALFFGGQKGMNYFHPENLKTNYNVPPVVLTDLMVNNKLVEPTTDGPIKVPLMLSSEVRLKYRQNFAIAFEALNFTAPEQNNYMYRLEGFDKTWMPVGKEHSAYYTNLDPGTYTFHVKASNNDGIWNEDGTSITVFVAPPFWRTNFAYAMYILCFLGGGWYMRHRGIKKLRANFAVEQERLRSKQLIEQERQEAEHLHRLDRMKIKFLTNLSHEFRTPISLIMGPVDQLLTTIKDDGTSSQLTLIKRNARRLLNLVNQLLDFRKMEEQEVKLHCSRGNIVAFLEEVSDVFNDMALRKKLDYAFYSELETLDVVFDHDKIERILFNLLSNAFKFTPEGGTITIGLDEKAELSDDNYVSLFITVKDTGIGIPKQDQERIFDSFFQHDVGEVVLNQGTGIGLAIARTFAQMHGGRLDVSSELGKGSCFSLHLRLKRAFGLPVFEASRLLGEMDTIDESASDLPATTNTSDLPSLLIIEDDDDFRFYIKDNLKSSCQVFEASNGKEGWQRALFHHPDIIVCDVHMPIMNGLELVQKLKADRRTKHIPVILLTAAEAKNGLLCSLECGASDYITKPFDFAVLQAKVNSLLTLNQALKDTYSKQLSIEAPKAVIVCEKERFLKKVAAFIYENMGNTQLSVETLSAYLAISRASLYNRLLAYTGMTPVDFIRSAKLERAALLLEKSDMTVAEVAYETGFANPNYFTKVFKGKYQQTPSEFILSVRKGNRNVLITEN
ncbi:response regulator [Olivibacter sp. SDN3]|uniref:hybrid sensor histidine kinase/response regulator transcription factor n=1 Tax=Olivibacter sp. SDN3 TaxID=2764720 RepID=UPI0016511C41|nr:hybrid sensor histidine kinase/response regulator transcription factor [Olivibacter sp. SDN3]QNL47925.1 response regulator [Olivibacter sp. SDN3]